MNDSGLYSEFSDIQKNDSKIFFLEFLTYSAVRNAEFKSILDVGCGPGNTLIDYVLPQLKNKPSKVVGVDISNQMIETAIEKYQNETIRFNVFDIQSSQFQAVDHLAPESYDLVTSFYCFHWVRDESQALSNIYNLMKPHGSFIMTFPIRSLFYDVWIQFSKTEKYKKYINLDNCVSLYYYEKDPVEVLRARLRKSGFKIQHVELQNKYFTFRNLQHIENSFRAINPFEMPKEIGDDFYKEGASLIAANCLKSQNESEFFTQYKQLVSIAVK